MDNFYIEDKEYIELSEELKKIDPSLSLDLTNVVGKAIQYGLEAMEKTIRGIK